MKYLIVNADDYGLTACVSRGIRDAHLQGIVTSTTAMMNMPTVEDALRDAVSQTPGLGLGVHLTLTAGRPLLPADQVRTLVDEKGRFVKPPQLAARGATIDLKQVRAEWQAQIERFCALLGHAPDHLDGHHHTSFAPLEAFAIMLDLAKEYGCPIRSPRADNDSGGISEDAGAAEQLLTARGVHHPDHMTTAFYDATATLENLLQIISNLKDGTTEIMSHPGYADEELLAISSYNRQRERELKVLTDGEVKSTLQQFGVQLTNFAGPMLTSSIQI